MGFRFALTFTALCLGLFSLLSSLRPPAEGHTFRLHRHVDTAWRQSRDWGHAVEDLANSQSALCNRVYVSYLQSEYRKTSSSWTPHGTVTRLASRYNPGLSHREARRIGRAITESGKRHGVDPLLLAALISHESRFHPDVVSPGGAVGLGQLLPSTAYRMGVDPFRTEDNVEGCARYLARQLKRWSHRGDKIDLALASYNAGPGAVEQYSGVPPYSVTRYYVSDICSRYRRFKQEAKKDRDRWMKSNTPVMKDLFGSMVRG